MASRCDADHTWMIGEMLLQYKKYQLAMLLLKDKWNEVLSIRQEHKFKHEIMSTFRLPPLSAKHVSCQIYSHFCSILTTFKTSNFLLVGCSIWKSGMGLKRTKHAYSHLIFLDAIQYCDIAIKRYYSTWQFLATDFYWPSKVSS